MANNRYSLRSTRDNDHPLYRRVNSDRGAKRITHYRAPKFAILSDDIFQIVDYEVVYRSISTRFWKLASEHYGDPSLWWVIAYFNKKPTEFHSKIGEAIYIPEQWEIIYNSIIEGDERYN